MGLRRPRPRQKKPRSWYRYEKVRRVGEEKEGTGQSKALAVGRKHIAVKQEGLSK